jgi:hypothetical protein
MAKSYRKSLLILGAIALIQGAAWGQPVPVVGDAFYSSTVATGTSPTVNVGGPTGFNGLIQFDLSAFPPGTNVSSAALRLFVSRIGAAGSIFV